MQGKEWCSGAFYKVVAPYSMRKGGSDQRKDLPFRRRFFGLGDLYRLGSEIFQIKEEPPVLGHSVAEQSPKQFTTHLSQ